MVALRSAVLLLVTSVAAPAHALDAPRAVVFVTLDTTRADHLGCYGYARPTSAFVDRLAREGVLFERAYSPASHTAPSHASIFTALYPAQHGVIVNGQGFPAPGPAGARPSYTTLAELFSAAGYRTAAFTSVAFLKGLTRGFSHVDLGGGRSYRQADATVQATLQWTHGLRASDHFFVWIHLYDAHGPSRAPARHLAALQFASPAAEAAFAGEAWTKWGVPRSYFKNAADLAGRYQKYDAEIRFADEQLAMLFEDLHSTARNRGTLWVVTADHGEGLGNHSHWGHGRLLYDEQLHVPLIFSGNGLPAGVRDASLVRLVDVMPTFAALLGKKLVQPGFTSEGRSLLPLLTRSGRLPANKAFAQRRPPDKARRLWERGDVFAVFDLDWKYIAHTQGEDEFYDLRKDPLELANLVKTPSPVKERLASLTRETWSKLRREGSSVPAGLVDPTTEEELRALGYIK
jgi:arylsulfatase A-like enzyme